MLRRVLQMLLSVYVTYWNNQSDDFSPILHTKARDGQVRWRERTKADNGGWLLGTIFEDCCWWLIIGVACDCWRSWALQGSTHFFHAFTVPVTSTRADRVNFLFAVARIPPEIHIINFDCVKNTEYWQGFFLASYVHLGKSWYGCHWAGFSIQEHSMRLKSFLLCISAYF